MTLQEFNKLNHDEKLFTVVDKGTFLDNYVTEVIRMNLYAVDKFFVELVYDGEHNTITEIRSFKTGHLLDKYSNPKFIKPIPKFFYPEIKADKSIYLLVYNQLYAILTKSVKIMISLIDNDSLLNLTFNLSE
jgi:hypothetical protein